MSCCCPPPIHDRYRADAVIVNGENAANGLGITPKVADMLLDGGGRHTTAIMSGATRRSAGEVRVGGDGAVVDVPGGRLGM